MSETQTQTSKAESPAPKLIAFIGMLYTFALAIQYFYVVPVDVLNLLWGIILIVIALLIFISFELIDTGPVKIPYEWWLMLIFGIVLIIIPYFFGGNYFPAILLLMAALVDIVMQKKSFDASKMVALIGCGFAAYESIVLLLSGVTINVINGIFGLLLIIILVFLIFDLIEIKVIDFSWWVLLIIGFVIFTWISPNAFGYPVLGYGGIILLIAFVLKLKEY